MGITELARSKDFNFDEMVTSLRQGRQLDIAPYSPIFYWIGWVVVAYFILYGLAYYVAPAIFGYTPGYYYRPPFGKSLIRQRRSTGTDETDSWGLSALAADVMSQIDSFMKKFQDDE